MDILHQLLCAIASEIAFVLSYSVILAILMLIILRLGIKPLLVEIIVGCISLFISCVVSYKLSNVFDLDITTINLFILGTILPLLGEISYYRHFKTQSLKMIFVGRIHISMKMICHLSMVKYYKTNTINYSKDREYALFLKGQNSERFNTVEEAQKFIESDKFEKSAEVDAWKSANEFAPNLFIGCFIGYVLSIFLTYYVLF